MSRGDTLTHADRLKVLEMYRKQPPAYASELRWVRSQAFEHRCRSDDVQAMLDNLVEPMKLLAIKERLTS